MSRVLISGAGIAGAVLAYWLGKNGFHVIVLERSPSPTQDGQIIDVEGPSREIVERMGILTEIQSKVTHEAGIRFLDENGQQCAVFPAGKANISKEIEIMRPVLAEVLLDVADEFSNVEFRYGCTIQSLQQTESKAIVDIEDKTTGRTSKEEYDILIACDGLRSKTRDMILSVSERESCLRSAKIFVAFFSIPAEPRDRPWANFYIAPGRRCALTKPWTETETSAYMTYAKYDSQLHYARESRDIAAQKERLASLFQNMGWETDRLISGMKEAQNFYFEEISQIFLKKWSYGRCVLTGDTAYCPSPLTGQGTNLAILGAYVLAYHLVENRDDPTKGLEGYERDLRPYVDKVQPIPLGGYLPFLLNPESAWGVWVIRSLAGWVSWLKPWKWFPDLGKGTPYVLPNL